MFLNSKNLVLFVLQKCEVSIFFDRAIILEVVAMILNFFLLQAVQIGRGISFSISRLIILRAKRSIIAPGLFLDFCWSLKACLSSVTFSLTKCVSDFPFSFFSSKKVCVASFAFNGLDFCLNLIQFKSPLC